jgi:hypothetical protein
VIATGQAIQQTWQTDVREHDEILRPDLVIKTPAGRTDAGKAQLVVQLYPASQHLEKPVAGKSWKASPDTRMAELLRATGIRLGLVTNGHRWMLVNVLPKETAGFASWYDNLWLEEPITLRAFRSLLSAERFFGVADADTLEPMLAESAQNQQEVTDQLGYQVRQAVEVLIQSLDRADQDHGRELLGSVAEAELYEASLTVMMRLVILFCAEERGLLLLGDPLFDQHYAVSTLRAQLRETADQHGEEVLERRHDAWCRLLSTFRAVYGGVEHERMTLPAYGGNLFDPDRFSFLEGRKKATTWREVPCDPLPVNNRTVLHLLEALQTLQVKVPGGGPAESRRLSFRALDIEQIGHVYEGLLDHTAKRATEPVLGLVGAKNQEPEIALAELGKLNGDTAEAKKKLLAFLKDETGKTEKALEKSLAVELFPEQISQFQVACGNDDKLWKRVKPFTGLIRDDDFGHPVVIPKGSVYVTEGTDRRSSGTHYTPRILTEPIVQYTLEPLVYLGPVEGKPKEEWKLHTPAELLELNICDMACGSGAFLVQACRYLAERLVESWEIAEKDHPGIPGITPEGTASTGMSGENLIPKDTDERMIFARRIVAQRCLYGVDKNPLAAEMAKLSLWLLTLQKDKPFTFLDHAIRSGDSLVGIYDLKQLRKFNLDPEGQDNSVFLQFLDERIKEAIHLRRQITTIQAQTAEDVQRQEGMLREVNGRLEMLRCAADMLIGAEFLPWELRELIEDQLKEEEKEDESEDDQRPSPQWAQAKKATARFRRAARKKAAIEVQVHFEDADLEGFQDATSLWLNGQETLHWPLAFPEVFVEQGGFDGIVGNPPFMGGQKITGNLSNEYREYLVDNLAGGQRGSADLCAYFFLRASTLLRPEGQFGLLATNTIAQGDTREVGLERLLSNGCSIPRAVASRAWPGFATVEVSHVWVRRGEWGGQRHLDDLPVPSISALLTPQDEVAPNPYVLCANTGHAFKGTDVTGLGFMLTPDEAHALQRANKDNCKILFPFLTGEDLNTYPDHASSRFVINFRDWPLNRQSAPMEYNGPVASDFPDCLGIVEERVKPQRLKSKDKRYRDFWWQFARRRDDLYAAIAELARVVVRAEVANLHSMAVVPTGIIFSNKICVFAFDDYASYAILQCGIHETWARHYAPTMRTDMSYSISDCFETFTFPGQQRGLSEVGRRYDAHRRQIMLARQEGLTKTYNRFHNPDEASDDIQELRDLHVEMDNAVASAYGWADLDFGHGFHETKQGLRFTISESARREVLGRLLKLNHERFAEEVEQGLHDKKKGGGKKSAKNAAEGPTLF